MFRDEELLGIKCPYCLSKDNNVTNTRTLESGMVIRRVRKCCVCGQTFRTREYYSSQVFKELEEMNGKEINEEAFEEKAQAERTAETTGERDTKEIMEAMMMCTKLSSEEKCDKCCEKCGLNMSLEKKMSAYKEVIDLLHLIDKCLM